MTYKVLAALALLFLFGCGGGSGGGGNDLLPPVADQPPAQGSRILGMDIKEVPSVTYDLAYDEAAAMGVREVSVPLVWAELEPMVGSYVNDLPATIEAYYPLKTGGLTLVLRPLDTPGPSLPTELVGLNFDNAAVIAAFENFLIHLHGQLPTLNASGKLKAIHVGNEIGAHLGSDAAKWAQWKTFFDAAKVKIETLWGTEIVVSSIIQFSDLNDTGKRAEYLNLLPSLDSATLTYYPLKSNFTMHAPSVVATDFNLMVSTISDKPILLQECGYPSSSINNSSELLQADFVSAVFDAWDTHRDHINLIDFAWQYDVVESQVDQWVLDFGMSGQPNENAFKQYLWTLGLKNYDTTEKLAMQRLRDELQAREWGL